MDDIVEEPTEEVGEKKEEQPEKAKNMSESEKEGYNEEFNKAIERPIPKYVIPPLDLLSKPKATSGDKREEMRRTAEKLISVLDNFGVKAKLLQVTQGPTVTRYEIQPDTGVKLSKIVGLADDIALNLAVSLFLLHLFRVRRLSVLKYLTTRLLLFQYAKCLNRMHSKMQSQN